jgi:hypothetical protein
MGRLALAAVLIAAAVWIVVAGMPAWELGDMAAYRGAAERLAAGQPLYPPPGPVLDTSEVYRYSPWFAVLWIPLQPIPDDVMRVIWSAVLVVASVGAVWPLLRQPTEVRVGVAALGFVLALRAAAIGNVEPLMVAALVNGVETRFGPMWIAAAASLKGGPLALALVYAGRREWARVAWTLALTAGLTLPILFFDLSNYPTAPGASISLLALAGPAVWLLVCAALSVLTLLLARTRFGWAAGAVTMLVALPRLGFYSLSELLVGINGWVRPARPTPPPPAVATP